MTDPVQVLVATGLMTEATVARFAASVPGGVEVSHVPLRWDDAFSEQPLTPDDLVLVARAHVLVGFPQQIGDLPARAPLLCWVQNYGAGYETVPLDALREAGIGFVTAAGAGAVGVAEFAVMALLSLARRAPERYGAHQRRTWDRFPTATLAENDYTGIFNGIFTKNTDKFTLPVSVTGTTTGEGPPGFETFTTTLTNTQNSYPPKPTGTAYMIDDNLLRSV